MLIPTPKGMMHPDIEVNVMPYLSVATWICNKLLIESTPPFQNLKYLLIFSPSGRYAYNLHDITQPLTLLNKKGIPQLLGY